MCVVVVWWCIVSMCVQSWIVTSHITYQWHHQHTTPILPHPHTHAQALLESLGFPFPDSDLASSITQSYPDVSERIDEAMKDLILDQDKDHGGKHVAA